MHHGNIVGADVCRLRAFQYLASELIKNPFLSVYLPEDEVGLRTYLHQQCGEWTSRSDLVHKSNGRRHGSCESGCSLYSAPGFSSHLF